MTQLIVTRPPPPEIDTFLAADLPQRLTGGIEMVIDLRVRRGNDDAIEARECFIAAEIAIDFGEDVVEKLGISLVDLPDAEKMNPHPALADRFDDLLARQLADITFTPALLR